MNEERWALRDPGSATAERIQLPTSIRVAALTLAALLAAACGSAPPEAAGPPRVVASIPPLAALAADVHRDPAAVRALLPPGANPHAFEPSPSEVRALLDARVVVRIGLGFDDWVLRALREAAVSGVRVVVASEGLELRPIPGTAGEARRADRQPPAAALDPHVWLDPLQGARIAARIAEALAAVDPAHAAGYRARSRALAKRLAALDRELEARLGPFRGAGFVSSHAVWGYFARRYGLVEVAVLEPVPGVSPGPRTLLAVAHRARERGARLLLGERELADRSLQVLAEETGLPLVELDPLAGGPRRGAYEAALRETGERLARGLASQAGRAERGEMPGRSRGSATRREEHP